MKNRILLFVFALMLCMLTVVSAGAADVSRLVDNADLLNDAEESDIVAKLDKISKAYDADFVIVTVSSLEGQDSEDYADLIYKEAGYSKDGVILLVCVTADPDEKNTMAIVGRGDAGEKFDDGEIEEVFDKIESDMKSGNYVRAFSDFAEHCDSVFAFNWGLSIIIALVIGFIIAFIVTGTMKAKLKSVRRQAAASNYIKAGSMRITDSKDLFLYKTVSRRARPKNNGSSGGSSGGRTSSGSRNF